MKVILTLNPGLLTNPDTDLRYTIPERLETLSDNQLVDDGFDYDESDNMVIFLSTQTLSEPKAIELVNSVCEDLKLESEAMVIESRE